MLSSTFPFCHALLSFHEYEYSLPFCLLWSKSISILQQCTNILEHFTSSKTSLLSLRTTSSFHRFSGPGFLHHKYYFIYATLLLSALLSFPRYHYDGGSFCYYMQKNCCVMVVKNTYYCRHCTFDYRPVKWDCKGRHLEENCLVFLLLSHFFYFTDFHSISFSLSFPTAFFPANMQNIKSAYITSQFKCLYAHKFMHKSWQIDQKIHHEIFSFRRVS